MKDRLVVYLKPDGSIGHTEVDRAALQAIQSLTTALFKFKIGAANGDEYHSLRAYGRSIRKKLDDERSNNIQTDRVIERDSENS